MKDWKDWLQVVELVTKIPLVVAGGFLAFYVSCNRDVLEPTRLPITMQTDLAMEVVSRHDQFLTVRTAIAIVNTGSKAVEILPSVLAVSVRSIEFLEQGEPDFESRVRDVLAGGPNEMVARWTKYGAPRVELVRKVYDLLRLEPGEARSKEFLFQIPSDSKKSLRAIVIFPAVADSAGMSVVWESTASGDIRPDYYYSAVPKASPPGRLLKPKDSKYDAEFLKNRKFRAFNAVVEIPLWPADSRVVVAAAQPQPTADS